MALPETTHDPLLSRLAAEGLDLDIREPRIDTAATIRKLKRAGIELRGLPKGLVGRRAKLREICRQRGIEPVWCD